MKRGTVSTDTDSNPKRGRSKESGEEEVSPIETQYYSGPSFSDLPRDILVNILLRLSITRIFVCKFVCKTLYDLVSGPEFAKHRFDEGDVYPLIRKSGSRMVYLVKPDNDDTKFKLLESNKCMELRKNDKRYEYSKASSCNGFLCLFDPFDSCLPVVCNPITGEFIYLPKPKNVDFQGNLIQYGLGFSPATNQYKVIRMFKGPECNMAEVHILGTKIWKDIDIPPRELPNFSDIAYLNGFLYWSCNVFPVSILAFDFEKEQFGSVSVPIMNPPHYYGSVGVSGGELIYTSRVSNSNDIHVWAMKDYGTEKEWSKVFSFEFVYSDQTRYCSTFRPIKYLNDGALLMFYCWSPKDGSQYPKYALLYMDTKRNRFRFLKIHAAKPVVVVIAHTPSFVSLGHALSGQNVKVHNVKSR